MHCIIIDINYRILAKYQADAPQVLHSFDLLTDLNTHEALELPLGEVGRNFKVVQLQGNIEESTLEGYISVSLRSLIVSLPEADFQLLGRAIQLCRWQTEHQYCGKCGGVTQASQVDEALTCPSCELSFYPKIAPCVIGLVCDGPRCLLARGSRHPEAMYSTLAGFIEAGENAEQAFAREVMEEVGVAVDNIRYLYSQPWPFPGQLMLGFIADYSGGDICVDGEEILEAHWFDYNELPLIPPQSTISGRIIRDFVRRQQTAK
ncbi:NAD+ diphosphatase [Alteromonadaceae bacterium 2753L.S.0a.02]|nr:NAD+ diphosphatase [Alteromonadaceae bacterium 2753L.S.0a.02]